MKNKNTAAPAVYVLLVSILLVSAYNQYTLQSMRMDSTPQAANSDYITGAAVDGSESSISLQEAVDSVMPKGVPDIYGPELGISFDTVEESLGILAPLDGDLYSNGQLKYSDLSDVNKERYVNIGSSISCEFCCGVGSVIFDDGKAACGCSHSAAMRSLAKYLLINHGDEYSDQEVLDELIKWKIVFFPREMVARYMESNGKTLENSALPGMVGGC